MPVSTLVVNMTMKSKGFNKSAGSITGGLGRIAGKALALAGALAGVAGIGGLGLLVKNSFNTIDGLAKTADKLGITTEGLGALRHAAELTGAGTNILDKGLQSMTRRLSDAAQGTGPAVKTLNELGLSAKALNRLNPQQQFSAIADAMKGVKNEGDKVRLTFDLFGASGVALKNTLAAGSSGLADMASEAAALGLAISRTDAAKIENANDAIFRMKEVFVGLAQTFAIKVAPVIESISARIVGMADDLNRFGRVTGAVFLSLVNFVGKWGSTLLKTVAILGTVKLAMLAITIAQKAIAVGQAIVLGLGGPAGWAVLAVGAGIAAVAIAGVNSEFEKLGKEVKQTVGGNQKLGESLGNLAANLRNVGVQGKAFTLKELLEKSITPAQKLNREIQRIWSIGLLDVVKNSPKLRGALNAVLNETIDSATGVFTRMRSVNDEILILQGRATATGITLRDMFEKGAPPEVVERLRKAFEFRDRLKRDSEARGVQQQQIAGLKSEAQSIFEQTRNPFEQFRAAVDRLRILRDQGFLDGDTFGRAIKQAREKFQSGKSDPEEEKKTAGPKFASAIDVRSKEGFAAIAKALAGTGRADPQKKTEENTKKTADLLKDKVVPALLENTKAVNKIKLPRVRGFKP